MQKKSAHSSSKSSLLEVPNWVPSIPFSHTFHGLHVFYIRIHGWLISLGSMLVNILVAWIRWLWVDLYMSKEKWWNLWVSNWKNTQIYQILYRYASVVRGGQCGVWMTCVNQLEEEVLRHCFNKPLWDKTFTNSKQKTNKQKWDYVINNFRYLKWRYWSI